MLRIERENDEMRACLRRIVAQWRYGMADVMAQAELLTREPE